MFKRNRSDERGRVRKDRKLSHEKQVKMAKALKDKGKSNADIAFIMRTSESTVRILLSPRIAEETTMWYPGVYEGRTDSEYGQPVNEVSEERIIELVQQRAKEDGEWAITNGFVGDNEGKMRRMMEFVSDPTNIRQCIKFIQVHGEAEERTVDYVCRDLANASKWAVNL